MKYKDIVLRTPIPGDIELLLKWENNPEIWQVSNTQSPYSMDEIRQHIEDSSTPISESGQKRFIICLSPGLTPIGTADLFDFDHFNSRVGIGILIADPANRRKGYAKMAVEALTGYCFNDLGVHQVYCNILSDNIASISLFEGAGFKHSGTRKDWVRANGGFKDELIYQMISTS